MVLQKVWRGRQTRHLVWTLTPEVGGTPHPSPHLSLPHLTPHSLTPPLISPLPHSVACCAAVPKGVAGGEGSPQPVGPPDLAALSEGAPAKEGLLCHSDTSGDGAGRAGEGGALRSTLLHLQAAFRGYMLRKRLAALLEGARVNLSEDGFAFPTDTEQLQEEFLEVGRVGNGRKGEGKGGERRGREGRGERRGEGNGEEGKGEVIMVSAHSSLQLMMCGDLWTHPAQRGLSSHPPLD